MHLLRVPLNMAGIFWVLPVLWYLAEPPHGNEIPETRLGFLDRSVQQKCMCRVHPSPLHHALDLKLK